ncbi:MAG: hypothetical protein ACYDEB_01005 [Dehalococcoidia bacterium]
MSAAPPRPYRRKLSREDADTGTILIAKARWRMFPPPMAEFAVRAGGRRFHTRIIAEDCDCVPPPHQHLHLEAGHLRGQLDFRPGALIEIARQGEEYVLRNG